LEAKEDWQVDFPAPLLKPFSVTMRAAHISILLLTGQHFFSSVSL